MILHRITVLSFLVIVIQTNFINSESKHGITVVYSSEEMQKLKELRNIMGDRLLFQDFLQSDHYLIRFLRARGMDVNKAAEMLAAAIKWRQDNKIEKILEWDNRKLKKKNPFYLDTGAIDGGVVLTVPLWNIRAFMLAGLREDMKLFVARVLEEAEILVRKVNTTNGILIVDLYTFSTRESGCLACLPFYYDLFWLYENIFPQLGRHIVLINAPRIFEDFLIQVLKPIMSPHTRRILRVYGVDASEYRKELSKIIRPEFISRRFGGNRTKK